MAMTCMHTYTAPATGRGPVRVVRVWRVMVSAFERRYRVTEHLDLDLPDAVNERTFSEYHRAVAYARKLAGVILARAEDTDTTGELEL